jgi:hypothetical protein
MVGGWGTLSDDRPSARSVLNPPAPAQAVESPVPVANTLVAEVPPVVLQTRWTIQWANARAEPREDALILEELPPGTQVEGVRHQSGWWLVYIYGDSVGYVAGALLRAQLPDSLKPGPSLQAQPADSVMAPQDLSGDT